MEDTSGVILLRISRGRLCELTVIFATARSDLSPTSTAITYNAETLAGIWGCNTQIVTQSRRFDIACPPPLKAKANALWPTARMRCSTKYRSKPIPGL